MSLENYHISFHLIIISFIEQLSNTPMSKNKFSAFIVNKSIYFELWTEHHRVRQLKWIIAKIPIIFVDVIYSPVYFIDSLVIITSRPKWQFWLQFVKYLKKKVINIESIVNKYYQANNKCIKVNNINIPKWTKTNRSYILYT